MLGTQLEYVTPMHACVCVCVSLVILELLMPFGVLL